MSKVLELVKKIKKDYIEKFGDIQYYYKDMSCIEYWASKLNNEEYDRILSMLNIRQYGDYVIFKYIKIEVLFSRDESITYSKFWNLYDGIFRECRGITIDVVNNEVVALPFDKFFNINECEENNEKNIRNMVKNAKYVEFSNKLDGSLIISRYYRDDIWLSSSSYAGDGSPIIRFARKCMDDNYKKLLMDYSDYTCMFESIFSGDPHIVVYSQREFGLYLIGMRNVKTGELKRYSEVIEIAQRYNVKSTEQYLVSLDYILDTKSHYKASQKEGFVMNIDGYLVKIKCDDYILFHRMAESNCSKNTIIKALYYDRIDDLRSSIPEPFIEKFDEDMGVIRTYCNLMDIHVNKYLENAPKDKVEFFNWVKSVPKFLRNYVINKYLGKNFSYLSYNDVVDNVKFVKFKEMEEFIEKLKDLK